MHKRVGDLFSIIFHNRMNLIKIETYMKTRMTNQTVEQTNMNTCKMTNCFLVAKLSKYRTYLYFKLGYRDASLVFLGIIVPKIT